jgi:hypothetical protein
VIVGRQTRGRAQRKRSSAEPADSRRVVSCCVLFLYLLKLKRRNPLCPPPPGACPINRHHLGDHNSAPFHPSGAHSKFARRPPRSDFNLDRSIVGARGPPPTYSFGGRPATKTSNRFAQCLARVPTQVANWPPFRHQRRIETMGANQPAAGPPIQVPSESAGARRAIDVGWRPQWTG